MALLSTALPTALSTTATLPRNLQLSSEHGEPEPFFPPPTLDLWPRLAPLAPNNPRSHVGDVHNSTVPSTTSLGPRLRLPLCARVSTLEYMVANVAMELHRARSYDWAGFVGAQDLLLIKPRRSLLLHLSQLIGLLVLKTSAQPTPESQSRTCADHHVSPCAAVSKDCLVLGSPCRLRRPSFIPSGHLSSSARRARGLGTSAIELGRADFTSEQLAEPLTHEACWG